MYSQVSSFDIDVLIAILSEIYRIYLTCWERPFVQSPKTTENIETR